MRYLDEFGIENVSPTRKLQIYANFAEEAIALEQRLTSKLPKLLNFLYLAYKFSHTCEIYFKNNPINVP
jgi:hypothetical protein